MIYLDHAATTPILPEVLDAMLPWFQPERVGNPGSIHTQGVKAHNAIEKARKQVAQMIGADPSEIFFTSGGTESNNAWLKCIESRWCAYAPTFITTKIEHSSVLEPVSKNRIEYVKVHCAGSVDLEDLEQLLQKYRGRVGAVSVMWVNNELGTINPIKEIGTICKKYRVPFHTDAVQAAGHVVIDVHDCGVDFLSLSGHKFGAPLGIGVLYISNAVRKHPLIIGGGQEREMRGGTENVPGIVGIGRAAEIVAANLTVHNQLWEYLRTVFLATLDADMHEEFTINGDTKNKSSNIISMTVPGVNSESLLLLLDQQEVYVSAGSACSASSSEPSHVLRGIGMSEEDAACTVRISMGFEQNYPEMVRAAHAIANAVHKVKSMYSQ